MTQLPDLWMLTDHKHIDVYFSEDTARQALKTSPGWKLYRYKAADATPVEAKA